MIADFEALAKLVKSRKPGVVKAWLARNRVKYFIDSKGHPATTLSALDRALNRFPDADLMFANTRGKAWTTSAIASQLKRLESPWAFKHLRGKAQTDAPHSVLGHGAALEALYRKELRTDPVR